MATRGNPERHHAAPRCLISLHEKANGTTSLDGEGIQAWVEWEMEAMRWRVPIEISREDLEALVEASEVALEREAHRLLHEGDWRRWGARGGKETLRRYGREWFGLLALRRWELISPEDLDAARASELSRPCPGGEAREGNPSGEGTGVALKPLKTAFNGREGR